MVSASGTTFKEIIADKRGRWRPGSIYVVKHINGVIAVKVKLDKGILR